MSDLENSGIITCTCYQSYIYILFYLFKDEAYVYIFVYLFNFGLRWVFVAVHGLFSSCGEWGPLSNEMHQLLIVSLAVEAHLAVGVIHGLTCLTACGIFPDQGSNLHPLHWQAASQPLDHQGSPKMKSILKCVSLLFHVCFLKHLPFISHTL